MRWTALVPIRLGVEGKTRLGAVLDGEARKRLATSMAGHVIAVLSRCPAVERTVVLSGRPFDHPDTDWARDEGRGLNPEIAAFRARLGPGPLLVIHADLPLLAVGDVEALLDAAVQHGAGIATDRAGEGTNALALADGRRFDFRFGPGSRALHCAADPEMPVLSRLGLSADLDTPADLAFLKERGWRA